MSKSLTSKFPDFLFEDCAQRALFFGSRDWDDPLPIMAWLMVLPAGTIVINGGATGADNMAASLAKVDGLEVITFPADWDTHGKAAGPIRNQQMMTDGRPTIAFGFVNKPLAQSRGSADMARRATAAGIPTYVTERL